MAQKGRLSTREFSRAFDEGQVLGHRWFTLRLVLPSEAVPGESTRWGIAVGKRLGGGAVARNRLRRRVAAAVRGIEPECAVQVVVQLKREGIDVPAVALSQAIGQRLRRELSRQCTRG
jgi:ribonuclease P protein component